MVMHMEQENSTGTNEQQNNYFETKLSFDVERLQQAILFVCEKTTKPLNRISLCKMLYYADGHYFQKHKKTITKTNYLHIEGSPQPAFFNEILGEMLHAKQIEVSPIIQKKVTTEGIVTVMNGLSYTCLQNYQADFFHRDEEKSLLSIVKTFQGDLSLETRHFPNLFQIYTQTGLCRVIPFEDLPTGGKPRLSWKSWSSRLFRLWWQ